MCCLHSCCLLWWLHFNTSMCHLHSCCLLWWLYFTPSMCRLHSCCLLWWLHFTPSMCRLHSCCLLWWLHFNTSIQESTPSTLACNFVPVLAFLMFSAAFQLFFVPYIIFPQPFGRFLFSFVLSLQHSIVFPLSLSFPFLLPLLFLLCFILLFGSFSLPVLIK